MTDLTLISYLHAHKGDAVLLIITLYITFFYTSQWSEVFSFDMFETRFKAEGLLNPRVGMDYRVKILQQGGSKDAEELLFDFLGRQPNEEAFLKAKGLEG